MPQSGTKVTVMLADNGALSSLYNLGLTDEAHFQKTGVLQMDPALLAGMAAEAAAKLEGKVVRTWQAGGAFAEIQLGAAQL